MKTRQNGQAAEWKHDEAERMAAIEPILLYASSWFTYHAGQRMQNFYFFLVLQGGLAAFLGTQYGKANSVPVLVIVGIIGFIGCLGFFALEVRNTELVMAGRNALDAIERQLTSRSPSLAEIAEAMPRQSDRNRKFLRGALTIRPADKSGRTVLCFLIRHVLVYRAIFVATFLSWTAFLIYAAQFYHP